MDKRFDDIITAGLSQNQRYQAFEKPGSWIYPAEVFEKASGLSGISHQYHVPDGMNSEKAHLFLVTKEIKSDIAGSLLEDVQDMPKPVTAEVVAEYAVGMQQQFDDMLGQLKTAQKSDAPWDEVEKLALACYRAEHKLSTAGTLGQMSEAFGEKLEAVLVEGSRELRADYEAEMLSFYDKLETLNPELKEIPADRGNIRRLRDVIDGALSHFNVPDIIGFSIDRITGIEARKDPEWVANSEAIQQKTNAFMGWIPSKGTQENVLEQLRQRETEKPQPRGFAERITAERSQPTVAVQR